MLKSPAELTVTLTPASWLNAPLVPRKVNDEAPVAVELFVPNVNVAVADPPADIDTEEGDHTVVATLLPNRRSFELGSTARESWSGSGWSPCRRRSLPASPSGWWGSS